MMSETFGWKEGLDKTFAQARGFYITMIISTLLGLGLLVFDINPIRALFYTAVLYGITAPVLILIILHICNNKKIMGEYSNKPLANIIGLLTFLLMSAAAVLLIYFQLA
jgi:Mn2+/Fe2+ NRAMP family transporter